MVENDFFYPAKYKQVYSFNQDVSLFRLPFVMQRTDSGAWGICLGKKPVDHLRKTINKIVK